MFGSKAVVVIPQYSMIFKYYLKGYADQSALPDEQQRIVDDYVEDVDGDIVLKFKKFLVEEGEMKLLSMVPRTSSMHLMTLLVRDMAQTGAKLLLMLLRVEDPKFLIPIKASGYLMESCQAWHGDF